MLRSHTKVLAVAIFIPPIIANILQLVLFGLLLSGYWDSIDRGPHDGKEHDTTATAMHEYAKAATGNLFLMNSGAIIAILTFVGHLFATDNETRINRAGKLTVAMIPSVAAFCCGLVCAVLLGFGYYFGLLHFVKTGTEYKSIWIFSWSTMLTSMMYFIAGAVFAMIALLSFTQQGQSGAAESLKDHSERHL
jgi:hypothetical protein